MLSLSQVHGALVTLVSKDSVGYSTSTNPNTAMLVGTRTLYGLTHERHARDYLLTSVASVKFWRKTRLVTLGKFQSRNLFTSLTKIRYASHLQLRGGGDQISFGLDPEEFGTWVWKKKRHVRTWPKWTDYLSSVHLNCPNMYIAHQEKALHFFLALLSPDARGYINLAQFQIALPPPGSRQTRDQPTYLPNPHSWPSQPAPLTSLPPAHEPHR